MAVVPDNTSTSTAITSLQTSKTWAHTCAGSDRVLRVRLAGYCDSGQQPTAVTYNGVALTKIADSGRSAGGDYVQIWRLIAPATGANNIVATFPASNVGGGAATSYTGADQTTPDGTPVTATGTSNSPSVTVSTASGEYIDDGVAADSGSAPTVGANQTAVLAVSANGESRGASYQAGADGGVMSWGLSTSTTWAMAAAPVKPVATAASRPITSRLITDRSRRLAAEWN